MSEQTGNSITLYAFFRASGVGKAGLTDIKVNAWRVTTAGVKTQVLTDEHDDVFEVGAGLYGIVIAGALAGDYVGTFHTDDADVDNQDEATLEQVGRGGVDHLDADVSSVLGSGDTLCTFTSKNGDGDPLESVKVWITNDAVGATLVAGPQYSNALGVTKWMLTTGTYYIWQQKAGYTFEMPEMEAVP